MSVNQKPVTTKSKRTSSLQTLLGAFTIIAVLILISLWYIGVFGGNIRTVVEGKVYRSAQLTGHNLADVLSTDNIHTDINLRGGSSTDKWYQSESDECQSHDTVLVNIPMSARRLPTPDQLNKLLFVFDHAQYPILFHCQAGADRSGLVGTLYLNIYQQVPLAQAESEELTWRYGHISWGQTHAMNDFFTLYDQTNKGMDLRTWIVKKYPALYLVSNEK